MASIPILAAVVSAIALPVVGTGIYYSVKPSKQEESTQQKSEKTRETPSKSTQFPRLPSNGGVMSRPNWNQGFTDLHGTTSNFIRGSSRLDTGRLGTAEQSLRPFIERSNQETQAAMESLNRSLETGNIPELPGANFPNSATLRVEETRSVSSSSSFTKS